MRLFSGRNPMPGRPSRWICSRCLGVISRLSHTKRRLDASRSRSSVASTSVMTAVRSSDASSTSMMRCGSREQRGRAHVGCQNFAVAVEDIGTRGRHRIGPHGARARRDCRAPPQTCTSRVGNDRITDGEDENGKPDPRARLDGAVDVAAIEQRVHQPPAPRVARGSAADLLRAHSSRSPLGRGHAAGRLAVENLGIGDHGPDRIGLLHRHEIGAAAPADCRACRFDVASAGFREDGAARDPEYARGCRAWPIPRAASQWRRARA